MAKAIKKAAKKAAKKSVRKPVGNASKKTAPKKGAPKKTAKPLQKSGKRFLIIYHAPVDPMTQMSNASPEEMEKGMAMWKAWAKRAGRKVTDLGSPLVNGKRLHSNRSSAPSNRDVTGYSLLEADNWEELEDLLYGHPHISGWHPDATIEVHETMLIPGM